MNSVKHMIILIPPTLPPSSAFLVTSIGHRVRVLCAGPAHWDRFLYSSCFLCSVPGNLLGNVAFYWDSAFLGHGPSISPLLFLTAVCSCLFSDFLFHIFPLQCCPKVNLCLTWSGHPHQCSGLTLALSVLRNHFWGFTGIICAAKDQTLVIYFKARVITPVLSLWLH